MSEQFAQIMGAHIYAKDSKLRLGLLLAVGEGVSIEPFIWGTTPLNHLIWGTTPLNHLNDDDLLVETCMYGWLIFRLLQVTESEDWDSLKRKYVRIRKDEAGEIVAIGHVVKNDWFCTGGNFAAKGGTE